MIYKYPFNYPLKNEERTLHIYLPDDYYNSHDTYPVSYYFDGHNLFSDDDATYGKSWGLKDFLESYNKKFIIIGIECSHTGQERLDEYCPYALNGSWLGNLKGYGEETMRWIIEDIKPWVDTHFRVMPFRETTMIAGSSMGGLMALYAAIKYNLFFSKAACLSPSAPMCEKQLKEEIANCELSPDTRIYFSSGSEESKGSMDRTSKRLEKELNKRGVITERRYFEGYYHCERDWEKQNKIYMDFLWF